MSPANGKHLIKKYSNRKLYDTHTSRYVTLEDIGELLRQGADIQVVDRDTGREITPLVLSQLVMSEEKRGLTGPAEVIQEKSQQILDYARRAINAPAEMVAGQVQRGVSDFETRVEDAIEVALRRLRIPSRTEMARVQRKLDDVSKRLDKLEGKGSRGAKTR